MSHKRDDNVSTEPDDGTKPDDGTGGMQGTHGGSDQDPSRPGGDVGSGGFTDTDFDGDGNAESTTDGRG